MSETLYEAIGGETAVRELVRRFYDNMYSFEGMEELQRMHDGDLEATKEKLFMYFSGWFGGPSLFIDRYGHPKLRARHRHIDIGTLERDQWLKCMSAALAAMDLPSQVHKDLWEKIEPMADHMRNKVGDGDPITDCDKK